MIKVSASSPALRCWRGTDTTIYRDKLSIKDFGNPLDSRNLSTLLAVAVGDFACRIAVGLCVHHKVVGADNADDFLNEQFRRTIHADVGVDFKAPL